MTNQGVGTNRHSYSGNEPGNDMDPSGNSAEYPTHAAKVLNWLFGTIGNTANAIQNGDKTGVIMEQGAGVVLGKFKAIKGIFAFGKKKLKLDGNVHASTRVG